MARVVVIHGHPLVGQALRAALNLASDVEVVGVADTVDDGISLAADLAAGVVVLDASIPGNNTVDAVARLTASPLAPRVVVIDRLADHRDVVGAIQNGAAGYLLLHQSIDDLADAIRAVHAGQTVVAPSLVPALMARLGSPAGQRAPLTRRDTEVLQLLAEGLSTAEMAKRLGVSVNTGRNNVQTVLMRLGAHSKLEAVAIALREGVIAPPRPAA